MESEPERECEADHIIDDLRMIAQGLRQDLRADAVTLFAYDKATHAFCLPIQDGLLDPEAFCAVTTRPRLDRVAGLVISGPSEVITPDVSRNPLVIGAFTQRERIKASAGFPLLSADTPVGVMFVNYRNTHDFSARECEVARTAARTAATRIVESHILETLRPTTAEHPQNHDDPLRAVAEWGCTVLAMPSAIWLLEPDGCTVRVHASTGLLSEYISVHATQGDGSVIAEVIESGKPVRIDDVRCDPRFQQRAYAERAGLVSMLALPIVCRGRTRGVIEAFPLGGSLPTLLEEEKLSRLAELARINLESAARAAEAQRLAELGRSLSALPDFQNSMRMIVDTARELTGADTSIMLLPDRVEGGFFIRSRSPGGATEVVSHSVKGLTRRLIDDGKPVVIGDVRDQLEPGELDPRIGSVVGVRVQLDAERLGALYVTSLSRNRFCQDDALLLQTLASHASIALGRARLLLKPSEAIENASAGFYDMEPVLRGICKSVESLGYDFAAVQLVRQPQNIVETVEGTGIAGSWVDRARHYLEKEEQLRDVQADILLAQPPRVEIISGYDSRFDKWLYENFQHDNLVRVFVPLILLRDQDGKVVETWFRSSHCGSPVRNDSKSGERTLIPLIPPDQDSIGRPLRAEVIGTIEAGFITRERSVSADLAVRTIELVMRHAVDIHRTRLEWVLETIVDQAKQAAGADWATLHFDYDEGNACYRFELYSGDLGQKMLAQSPPRATGLGRHAVEARQPKFVPNRYEGHATDQLRIEHPIAWANGIRAMAAIPLLIGRMDIGEASGEKDKPPKEGVLYIGFSSEHLFTDDDIGAVQFFANWAADAIRHALTFTDMREKVRQLRNLHSVAESLINQPEDGDLLRRIAWNALNVLAADVVTIYEYLASEKKVMPLHDWAGRLVDEEAMKLIVHAQDVPVQVINNVDVYTESVKGHLILDSGIRRSNERPSFIGRERIVSAAALALRVGKEIVGVMFVNYRRRHKFPEDEKKIIQTLASSAAIGIKNRRILALSAADPSLGELRDLDHTLKQILERAVKITEAEEGEIRLFDVLTQQMARRVCYPNDRCADPNACLPDGTSRSKLQVFLDSENRRLGELWVTRSAPFGERERFKLASLTTQAVVAILLSEKQEQLVASEAFATMGALKGSFYHYQGNTAAAIQEVARQIRDQSDSEVRKKAIDIETGAAALLKEAMKLNTWVAEKIGPVDVWSAIEDALKNNNVPKSVEVELLRPSRGNFAVLAGHLQLVEVFRNLIRNAIEAMPAGGKLTIGVNRFGTVGGPSSVQAFVEDTGTGIPEELASKIFEPFYTTKSREYGGHAGYGLWWTQQCVRRFRGSVNVNGSRFTVALPGVPEAR